MFLAHISNSNNALDSVYDPLFLKFAFQKSRTYVDGISTYILSKCLDDQWCQDCV